MKKKSSDYHSACFGFVESVLSGEKIAGKEIIEACQRFVDDLENPAFDFRERDANFVCAIIERTMFHKQGEDLEGRPLKGTPFLLQPWQVFAVYNICGFFKAGTDERRFKETFIFLPRKSGKTSTVAALAYGLALLSRKSGSTVYLIAATAKQAYQSFEFIKNSLEASGAISEFKVRDSYVEHSMSCDMGAAGYIKIEALASNPKGHDSFNAPICIADELHAIDGAEYNRFKEAQKAYTNKLMIGISTAGDNPNSFCYRRLQYSKKVVSGEIRDDTLFVMIAKADEDEDGNVDFTNPIQHEKANPSYGVTIRPDDILQDALQAQNDPQQRKDFLSRSLNVYTSAVRAYFNMDEFEASDSKYSWTLEELAKLPIDWYGGADLSKMHDLTATALYGSYQGVDITITHAFFPRVMAHLKADEDNIPLFGWADDGLLTLCNSPTVNYSDVVNWFVDMRQKGFKIKRVGFDKKFGREFFTGMKTAGFSIEDAPQYYWRKSEGFRHIEKMAKDGNFYFLHSDAFRYCASNVAAVEKTDDMVQYEKVNYTQRIDIFDACVFSCCKMLEDDERERKASSWWS